MRRWLWLVLVVFSSGLSLEARAQVHSAAERAAARDLGYEGVQEYQAGNYDAALDRLEKAYRILKAPSLALWSARALEQCGRLVEAAERYLEASRIPLDQGGDRAVQEQAIAEAEAEREELLPRIPRVIIEVRGADAEFEVHIADREIAHEMLNVPMPVDPGELVVRASAGGRSVEEKVVLTEGARETIVLDLNGSSATEDAGPATSSTTPPSEPTVDGGATGGNGRRIAAWTTLGLGAAAILGGGVTTAILAQKRGSLDCEDGICPAGTDQDQVNSFNSLRPVPTVLFAVGGVLVASGVVLHLTTPRKDSSAFIGPYVGLASAGLAGRF